MSYENKILYSIASIEDINFWALPKCGNTTIKYKLLELYNPQIIKEIPSDNINMWVHGTKLMDYITPFEAISNGKYNFTFIRNPIDRFISMYKDFSLTRKMKALHGDSINEFIRYLENELLDEINANIHFRKQSYFLEHFNGDIFDIDDYTSEKHNVRTMNIELNTKQEERIKYLYSDDYKYFDSVKDITTFFLQ